MDAVTETLKSQTEKNRFETFFRESPVGLYRNLPSGRFVEVNDRFARILGYDTPEQLCRQLEDIDTQLYERAGLRAHFRALVEEKPFVSGLEFEARRRDGNVIWLRVSARAHKSNGRVLYYHGTAEDISRRKQEEKSLRDLVQSLQGHVLTLERANRRLRDYTGVAAHELREPLRTLSSFLRNLSRQPELGRHARELLDFALRESKRLKQLITDLVVYHQSGLGADESTRRTVDTHELATRALWELRREVDEAGAKIQLSPLPKVDGLADQLFLVFRHLIGNALKFRAARNPSVSISAAPEEGYWRFEVRDNGIGFEMADATRIFEPFQRLNSIGEYPGSGLGLTICKQIIEGHGGKIWAVSRPAGGTSIFFRLPDYGISSSAKL